MSNAVTRNEYDGPMAATLVQKPETIMLDATHRCDRCGAQAYVHASHENWPGEILFCAHHGREHVPALLEAGAWVHDESDRLIENVADQKLAKDAV